MHNETRAHTAGTLGDMFKISIHGAAAAEGISRPASPPESVPACLPPSLPSQIYWDGLLAASALTKKTTPLQPGGALMLGAEQDCYGGCTDRHAAGGVPVLLSVLERSRGRLCTAGSCSWQSLVAAAARPPGRH